METSPSIVYVKQYQARLDRIALHIRDHCTDDLSLEELAKMAGFSKFHFSRIFQACFGETVRDYIRRIRLEKAAGLLTSGQEPSITRIAYDCGFSSSQHFTNLFRAYYGIPPSQVRSGRNLKDLFLKRMENQEFCPAQLSWPSGQKRSDSQIIKIPVPQGIADDEDALTLEVFEMPPCRVAYVRVLTKPGGDEIGRAMEKIIEWAAPKGIFGGDAMLMGAITGDPDPQGQLVYDASVSVPDEIDADESQGIRIQNLPGGEYGIYQGKFQTFADIPAAWSRLFPGLWMSRYFPQNRRPSCEIYYNDGRLHPKGTWFVDLCLPIKTR